MSNRKYITFNYPTSQGGGKTLLTGIRDVIDNKGQVYISGFYKYPTQSASVVPFVYKGTMGGTGTWHVLNYPSSYGTTVIETNLYGPNNGAKHNHIQVVGNYTTEETNGSSIGCLYEGPLDGTGLWTTLIPISSKPVLNTIAHSTMGGYVVGNYSTKQLHSKAFIYDIKNKKFHKILKSDSKSITAYGIWHNKKNQYTICGGYTNGNVETGINTGYLVDWDSDTHRFSNWKSFNYDNNPLTAIITHFDGITSDNHNGYYLTGDWIGRSPNSSKLGFFAHVKRKPNNKFTKAIWSSISCDNYPTSGNSVYKKAVIGVYVISEDTVNGYISL